MNYWEPSGGRLLFVFVGGFVLCWWVQGEKERVNTQKNCQEDKLNVSWWVQGEKERASAQHSQEHWVWLVTEGTRTQPGRECWVWLVNEATSTQPGREHWVWPVTEATSAQPSQTNLIVQNIIVKSFRPFDHTTFLCYTN